jgi:hypothetical protein
VKIKILRTDGLPSGADRNSYNLNSVQTFRFR